MSDERIENGEFIPKHRIAYWVPITHEMKEVVERIRDLYRRLDDGHNTAPFQAVERTLMEHESCLKTDVYE